MELTPENCTDLESLDISHNQIVSLPEELGNCETLRRLLLSHNRLDRIFDNCRSLSSLTVLDIRNNLVREIPSTLFASTPLLQILQLDNNRLEEIGGDVHELARLETLTASGNRISNIPWRIYKLTCLRTLALSRNCITSLPRNKYTDAPEFGKLVRIESVDLSYNCIAEIGDEIGDCVELRVLRLDGNRLTALPDSLGQCRRLDELSVANNALREIPSMAIKHLSNLRVLDLSSNDLTTLPREMRHLTSLHVLKLSPNRIREIPDDFGSTLSSVTTLELSHNELTSLPRGIGGMKSLTSLNLSPNRIVRLPSSLGQLTALTELNVSHNQLEEVNASAIGRLVSLVDLDLSHNNLSRLPNEIGRLCELRVLRVNHNQLHSFPSSVAHLKSLKKLFAQHNRLRSLPSSMARLKSIVGCDLSHNMFPQTPTLFKSTAGWMFCDMTGNDGVGVVDSQDEDARRLYFGAKREFERGNASRTVVMTTALLDNVRSYAMCASGELSTTYRAQVHLLRARAYAASGALECSAADLRAAEECGHEMTPSFLLFRAHIMRRLNEPSRALNDLDVLIRIRPDTKVGLLRRARLRFQCGQFRSAHDDVNMLLSCPVLTIDNAAHSRDADLSDVIALSLHRETADQIVSSIAVDPFDANMLLGHIRLKINQHNQALHAFETAVRWRPSRPEGHLYIAIARQKRNEHEEALKSFAEGERLLNNTSSKETCASSERSTLHPEDIAYVDELRIRLLLRRQTTYCILGKMKLARADWNCAHVLQVHRDDTNDATVSTVSDPIEDERFLCSFGRIERPRTCTPLWRPSTTTVNEMVTRPSTFWQSFRSRTELTLTLRRHEAATCIQAAVRGCRDRKLARSEKCARYVQAWFRGSFYRRGRQKRRVAVLLQSMLRGYRDRKRASRRAALREAVRIVLRHTLEHRDMLRFVMTDILQHDEDFEDAIDDIEDLDDTSEETMTTIREWFQRARSLVLHLDAVHVAARALRSEQMRIVESERDPHVAAKDIMDIVFKTANDYVCNRILASCGKCLALNDKNREEGTTSILHRSGILVGHAVNRELNGPSSIHRLRTLPGVLPTIPAPLLAFRDKHKYMSRAMYHDFVRHRASSLSSSSVQSRVEIVSSFAALAAQDAARDAMSQCVSAMKFVNVVIAHNDLVEHGALKERAMSMGIEQDDENHEHETLVIELAVSVARIASENASAAHNVAMRASYVAYRRMTVELKERRVVSLWRTPTPSFSNTELLECPRGALLIEMARTRDGWSWVAFDPELGEKTRRRLELVRVGVVPSAYVAHQKADVSQAASLSFRRIAFCARDSSQDTPATLHKRRAVLVTSLKNWLARSVESVQRAFTSIRGSSLPKSGDL